MHPKPLDKPMIYTHLSPAALQGWPDGGTLKAHGKTQIWRNPGGFKAQKGVQLPEPRKVGREHREPAGAAPHRT